ncbi:MAG: hypothetical protein HDS75_02015 [Bacteroidales bacterium]|nr:hypothetical protein [Bacteroidales bacterium]
MKLLHKIFLLLIISVSATQFINAGSIRYYRPGEKIEYDSIQYMVKDPSFETPYEKLSKMFSGEIPYNLKDAEFLVENAYYGGTVDYEQYCHDIDSVVRVLQ